MKTIISRVYSLFFVVVFLNICGVAHGWDAIKRAARTTKETVTGAAHTAKDAVVGATQTAGRTINSAADTVSNAAQAGWDKTKQATQSGVNYLRVGHPSEFEQRKREELEQQLEKYYQNTDIPSTTSKPVQQSAVTYQADYQ